MRAVRLRPPPARASISASARHRGEVLAASLVHRHHPPRRQEPAPSTGTRLPATPSWAVAFFSLQLLPSRSTVAPIAPATTSSLIVKRNLRPFNPPRSSSHFDSHLRLPPPPSPTGPTESNRRRPIFLCISHAAFAPLTTIAFATPIHGRNHQSTHSIARPPHIHLPEDWNRRRAPSPPESSTVARVRAWGSANPRNAVQGHTWCEACHHHALPRCRSRRSRRLPRSTSTLKMRGAGTSSPPRPHRIPGGLEFPSPTCDALPSVPIPSPHPFHRRHC